MTKNNYQERTQFDLAYSNAVENGWESTKELARYMWDQAHAKQPASVVAPDATGRTPQDYAIEHAEYMAVAAESAISDYQAYSKACIDFEERDDGDASEEAFEAVNNAESDLTDALINLQSMIYEFRKRRDRAAAPHPVSGEQKPAGYLIEAFERTGTVRRKQYSDRPFNSAINDALDWKGSLEVRSIPLYAAPPATQDVSGLVEALEKIVRHYPHPDIPHVDYRVHACRQAEHALAAHRAQQGEQP
ncbi:hypothetical protein BVH03_22375 [Pseudomonas sp. PA15(2017)]|uniref:hypothetical protein n=1 Tax=Pseudomonas sp. PA15(2017) TaxID=1932111 RepID=UPI0009640123|nr:hypothetical protein [Pseudomonas sp. PA15(2017)]OLU22993.1 hypothetical protein BVH03_22375 [Pseudomonas sp. PA15(2017)]